MRQLGVRRHNCHRSRQSDNSGTLRVDKWLWAARFFKTRALAKSAVENGKVRINGQKIKPSRSLNLNDQVEITQGELSKTVVVMKLEDRRKGAPEAAQLYCETEQSQQERSLYLEKKRALAPTPKPDQRPTKKARRQIVRFNQFPNI